LDNYRITEGARVLADFVDELSNWYVRRSRERFWVKEMPQDKINAYMTLYTALVTVCKLSAPFIPFMTEDIYQNLVCNVDKEAPKSIHLCNYPVCNEAWIDTELEADMEEVLEVVVLGRACRNAANIKNRQPIGKMYVKAEKAVSEFYTAIIAEELNVKEVVFTDDVRNFTSYSFKPQLKTLGPKFGKQIGTIRTILAELNGNEAMDEINATGQLKINIDGSEAVLEKDDLLIEAAQTEGFISDSDHGITVVLDTNLTEDLIEEGFVNEIISKIQTMRKEANFEVMDQIRVSQSGNDKIKEIILRNAEEIKTQVLAKELVTDTVQGFVKEWNVNGEEVTLSVEKL
jgi:isoleucyl-tRNA synthetase